MLDPREVSRRGFVKAVGGLAGAAALPAEVWARSPDALPPQISGAVQPALALRNAGTYPGLTPRGAGWLRFLWEKATTRDDWSSVGIPHPWWDRYSAPVVLSYGRFDLSFSAYGLLASSGAPQAPMWPERGSAHPTRSRVNHWSVRRWRV